MSSSKKLAQSSMNLLFSSIIINFEVKELVIVIGLQAPSQPTQALSS